MKVASLVLAVSLLIPVFASAEPVAAVKRGGIKITLFDSDCTLPAVMSLPFHVEWVEKGKTFAGCWILHPTDVILMYFVDKTVVILPAQEFKKVSAI